jgi:hypothetical protein
LLPFNEPQVTPKDVQGAQVAGYEDENYGQESDHDNDCHSRLIMS